MRKLPASLLLVFAFVTASSCNDDNAPTASTGGTTALPGSTSDPGLDTFVVEESGVADSTGTECGLGNVSVCDDADPCTIDDCFGGVCVNDPHPEGTPCTTADDLNGSCQGGVCVIGCTADEECDDKNPCTADSCDPAVSQCAFEDLDDVEAPVSAQTDGDCQVLLCQDGEAVGDADNGDVPDDGMECTTDQCIAGEPSHNPFPPGTGCGADGLCNDAGECVECISPVDCTDLPEDDDCQTRTCVDGVCGQDFTAAGTPVNAALQTTGNCQQIVCDGAGDMESEDDDTDPFVDGLECTDDTCNSGVPLNPPVDEGTECAAGVCNAVGQCVGCQTPADCGGTNTFCQTITCIASICGVDNTVGGIPLPAGLQIPSDCQELQCDGTGSTQAVPDADDVPLDDGNLCTAEICSNGLPLHPDEPPGTDCDDGTFCNGADTCDGAGTCESPGNPCPGGDGDSDCSETCDEVTGACSANDPVGSVCDDGVFCTLGDSCNASGTCVAGAGSPCPGPDGDSNCSESCNAANNTCTAPDPVGSSCDDGMFCTGADTCGAGGTCQGAGDPCAEAVPDANCADACDEVNNNCSGNVSNGGACNDGLFCTGTEACNGLGVCASSGNPCPGADGDSDCSEQCVETGGGTGNCNGNDPALVPCDDGQFCTVTDSCNGLGGCTGSGNPCPGPDGDSDCSESCDETANDCVANDVAGAICNDGTFCNGADQCNGSGGCTLHPFGDPCPGPSGDGDNDCSEVCDEAVDACSANDNNAAFCTDGLFCNGVDQCFNGVCSVHAGSPCPGPDNDSNCEETCSEFNNDCLGNDPVDSPCNDGLFCNGTETCQLDGMGGRVCTDSSGDPCTVNVGDNDCDCSESCDDVSDACVANDPAGSHCGPAGGPATCSAAGNCSVACP